VQVAGLDVSRLHPDEAHRRLERVLVPLLAPLELRLESETVRLQPVELGLKILYEGMIAEAVDAGAGARIPLRVSYDEARVLAALNDLATRMDEPPAFSVLTSTLPLSRSFALRPGRELDITAAAAQIGTSLRTPGASRAITLTLREERAPRPEPAQLQEQIELAAKQWKGVVGVYVYDLEREALVAQLNGGTVFSGASVMKVPIMLHTYLSLPGFSAKQEDWLRYMIVDSDNWSANQLLAASAGGSGIPAALEGVERMTEMLQGLGLQHTYQYAPYQSRDWLLKRNVRLKTGPVQEGEPPYTAADRRLRTTPAEISQVFLLIEQCSRGRGLLLERYGQQLSAARCREMIDRLRANADRARLVAGLPGNADVAHKSGWINDMQADVGIVYSPGGTYLAAIYLYQRQNFANSAQATPSIGRLSRLIYSYFNPVEIGGDQEGVLPLQLPLAPLK
jgi:beta-lactamase class A